MKYKLLVFEHLCGCGNVCEQVRERNQKCVQVCVRETPFDADEHKNHIISLYLLKKIIKNVRVCAFAFAFVGGVLRLRCVCVCVYRCACFAQKLVCLQFRLKLILIENSF